MSCQWVFERLADGLFLGPRHPLRHLCKLHRQGVLLDRNGTPLTADNIHTATTWRSHHAFSGRCGLRVDQQQQQQQGEGEGKGKEREDEGENSKQQTLQKNANSYGGGDVPQPETVLEESGEAIVSQSPDDYRTWIADFHLLSKSDEPHVLLSVAPHFLPLQGNTTEEKVWHSPTKEDQEIYDKRMLETPLIWEEPMTLSVDCTSNGMYLWSEEWGFFGEKIADSCFEQQVHRRVVGDYHSNNRNGIQESLQQQEQIEEWQQEKSHEAFVRLSWRMKPAGEQDARSGEHRSLHDSTFTHINENFQSYGEMVVFVRSGSSQDNVCNDRNNGSTGGGGDDGNSGGSGMSLVVSAITTTLLSSSSSSSGGLNGCKGTEGGELISSGNHVWRRVCERVVVLNGILQEMHFVPYVTLMDDGDEVTIL
ncbi:uncharacterized protein TM35_000014250 [Trypanosoma theileri]|uniref:Uncharacterized protein n=1 Tax=Trypanosoma theileri TaxID=67003 RepID=A0A1X0P9I6_9TRYP|nr:uncharacterized protein TM35_000014250 [Trypanosoma theileri]ORC93548.1 hypothetical protein TM35_000014250 [Trypanosoma theileri]